MVREQQRCETGSRRERVADESEKGCQVCKVVKKTKAGGKTVILLREKERGDDMEENEGQKQADKMIWS